MATSWADLKNKGFVLTKNFLSEAELVLLRRDYERESAGETQNKNYDVVDVAPSTIMRLENRLRPLEREIQAASGITADAAVQSYYFATQRGIGFPWHQDHESYFVLQEHYHYLNFYIPFVKPEPTRSNLCLIPFDRLLAVGGEACRRLIGSGANSFAAQGTSTTVHDDENGNTYTLPLNIEDIKVVPELGAGDLLVMRGDVIHRTQDTETERIAISLRRVRGASVIRKTRLLSGGQKKREMMEKDKQAYQIVFDCFGKHNRGEITVRELVAFYLARAAM